MQFVINAYDGKDEGAYERRMSVRPQHLENIARIDGKVVCAGGLLDEYGKMKGSVLILDFDSREKLDAYLASEPYITEAVWKKPFPLKRRNCWSVSSGAIQTMISNM